MLLTEEEAKTKKCPIHRATSVFDDEKATIWRFECIGSACMAWQWGDTPRETMRAYHDDPNAPPATWVSSNRSYADGWQYQHTGIDRDGRKFDLLHRSPPDDAPKVGFCGLAGKSVL